MSRLFNTPFEISLRVIVILSEDENTFLSADMISASDFISIYGKAFGIATFNLHGDSPFIFSEFANRRSLLQQSLTQLVADGFIDVHCTENGYFYSITKNGLRYSDSFETKYSDTLREMIKLTRIYTDNKSENCLLEIINRHAINALKKGGD